MESTKTAGMRHIVTAGDVTATTIVIPTGGKQLTGAVVAVRDAAGIVKAWNGAVIMTAESITLDNTGATDWIATDIIDIISF